MVQEIISFKDANSHHVCLSFIDHPFSTKPGHVWVICRYLGKWLLTKHSIRGYEFPGGKIEVGESPVEAAKREVYEETGGVVSSLTYIGQYVVEEEHRTIIKNIYLALIEKMENNADYLETDGPILIQTLPINIKNDPNFSFIMKDDVLPNVLKKITEKRLID